MTSAVDCSGAGSYSSDAFRRRGEGMRMREQLEGAAYAVQHQWNLRRMRHTSLFTSPPRAELVMSIVQAFGLLHVKLICGYAICE
eukprot:588472-Pleurochrysis_carterae.AAC.4